MTQQRCCTMQRRFHLRFEMHIGAVLEQNVDEIEMRTLLFFKLATV